MQDAYDPYSLVVLPYDFYHLIDLESFGVKSERRLVGSAGLEQVL